MKLLTPEELDLNLKAATAAKDTNQMAAVFYVALTELKQLREERAGLVWGLNKIAATVDHNAAIDPAELARIARNALPE